MILREWKRSGLFQYLNMNKKGITLNPEKAAGRKILNQLLKAPTFLWKIILRSESRS